MVYGYIRVSTDKQDVENQKIGINKKAEELGFSIEQWISDEGVSGMKEYAKRNLGVLMEKLQEGDILIISEISRLARSVFMLFRIIELCNNLKVVIHSVKDSINTVKPGDLTSMMMIFCFGIAAQIEREMIVKRTKEGLERRKQAGVIMGRPVGAKTKKEYAKHKTITEQLPQYINKGISNAAIAKIFGIARGTLNSIMSKYGITNNAESKSVYAIKKRWDSGEFKKRVPEWHLKELDYIKELIENGATAKRIFEKLQEKGYECNYNHICYFFTKNPYLKDLMTKKQAEIRPITNAECGKNRANYRL